MLSTISSGVSNCLPDWVGFQLQVHQTGTLQYTEGQRRNSHNVLIRRFMSGSPCMSGCCGTRTGPFTRRGKLPAKGAPIPGKKPFCEKFDLGRYMMFRKTITNTCYSTYLSRIQAFSPLQYHGTQVEWRTDDAVAGSVKQRRERESCTSLPTFCLTDAGAMIRIKLKVSCVCMASSFIRLPTEVNGVNAVRRDRSGTENVSNVERQLKGKDDAYFYLQGFISTNYLRDD
ncbi:hypothetical protein TREMEDRAFT_63297 [Tremella mesenterica DSM 1558]|uniref:uncharacterized protein n=1 Tax=Tremella mesenterica (strain ATCC 24925 / CBS 8224 / DSM 1558 / NBRC 9311 / NRRL Y-6157 / RJB 2259-6 / UBC 559-6) TaxID=578456 RepID=UPI0003F496ED|nr:uncharacterized protein TREMEDRAFT_63297 [Tremella mesenterica DSM 1558]EIW68832.1 hypothetical protein TREMEDRAFT_63297 [Tremella mesenterica DSM 1558]